MERKSSLPSFRRPALSRRHSSVPERHLPLWSPLSQRTLSFGQRTLSFAAVEREMEKATRPSRVVSLETVSRGDALNFIEASRPSAAFLAAALDEEDSSEPSSSSSSFLFGGSDLGGGAGGGAVAGTSSSESVAAPTEAQALLLSQGGRKALSEAAAPPLRKKRLHHKQARAGVEMDSAILGNCSKALLVDLVASFVVFFLTAVIYVSGAQSILGPYYESRLTFVALQTMLSGTALTGLAFACLSSVPWAAASVDVGFLPLLGHLGEICYHGVVVHADRKKHQDDDQLAGSFAATFAVSQAVMFVCVGLALWSLGALRLTRLSNYLPYPVTAGLLASIGVSLAKSGFKVSSKVGFRDAGPLVGGLWVVCCLSLVLASHVLKRLKVPGYVATPVVVFAGSLGLFLGGLFLRIDRKDLETKYGALFHYDSTSPNGFFLYTAGSSGSAMGGGTPMMGLGRVRWSVVGDGKAVYLAATLIGALKLGIKFGSFAAMFPSSDVDVDDEMKLAGVANVVAGLLGSAGMAHSFSAIKIQQQLQASTKRAAALVPLWCLVAWLRGVGALLAVVPRFVFGALLVELGLDYVDAYLLYPLRRMVEATLSSSSSSSQKSFQKTSSSTKRGASSKASSTTTTTTNYDLVDAATLVTIVVAAVVSNLLTAVGLGMVFSVVGVSRRLAQRSIVARTASGKDVRSTIERPPRAMAVLDKKAEAIFVIDLVGYVFFGSAHELVDLVVDRAKEKELTTLKHLVVDVSQCLPQFDVTAIASFEKILVLANARHFRLHLAPASSEPCLAVADGLRACGETAGALFDKHGRFFDTVDDALEHCEDALLAEEVVVVKGGSTIQSQSQSQSSLLHLDELGGRGRQSSTDLPLSTTEDDDDVGVDVDDDPDDPDSSTSRGSGDLAGAFRSLGHYSSDILHKKELIRCWLFASAVPLEVLFPSRSGRRQPPTEENQDDDDDDDKVDDERPGPGPAALERTRGPPSVDERDLDGFVSALATKVAVAHAIDFQDGDDEKVFALLVQGRVRLNSTSTGACVRKLADGSAVGVGDYYALDDSIDDVTSGQQFTLIQTSPRVTVLHLKYADVQQLEVDDPQVAIQFHKLMARSLAQKNRNSKLQHRTMEG